jgi:hypothetical protein
MMTNRYKRAVIEDISCHGIDDATQSNLLDLFEHAMKSIATTLAREARFDTADFASAPQHGCGGFHLIVSRLRADGRETWRGEFSKGDQQLTVFGCLE